ncbi:gp53-like domain-containing protein [Janthinobacterium sp. GMG1]|uniref:gp53-like domain-containing protein n=1 Tax=Janthinobacterium sp. GMG1 TaxID=3096007 RepID=UPI002ACA78C3|nr:hypothetical protein [Janthinobacterium sp. GMG1]MDZ5633925.1 hypothetical protein [Janthinobacterium sp. GMG1]
MKRQIIYPGQIPLETDLLGTNKNTMIALAKLTAAIFGTATMVNGLACAPNSPAALNVVISPGEIYSMQNIDGTAYSSIAADTTHTIMKQGISLDAVTLACAAPGTAGQSINYLIQAAYSEVDSGAVVLPYYNASNPSMAYSGPAGSGATNNTVRDGTVALSAKAGIAATTGTQSTPAADAGYVGLWVVTVANGQTSIAAGSIVQYVNAPFFGTAALLNSMNAFTVSPTGPTPPQFDASTKLVTAEWVRQQQGSLVAQASVSVSRSLIAADIGKCLNFTNPGLTLTLPRPIDLGIPTNSGRCIHLFGFLQSGAVAPGAGASIAFGTGAVASITLKLGQYVTLTATSSDYWTVIDSTADMWRNADFETSITGGGATSNQLSPGGIICQTGFFLASASGYTTLTFPAAFPNGLLSINGNINLGTLGAGTVNFNMDAKTASGVPVAVVNSSASGYLGYRINYTARGY